MRYTSCTKNFLEDFNTYLEEHPGILVVEMDTVKSKHGSKRTILTMIFHNSNLRLGFLMEHMFV